jgi:hypothetical protein
MMNGKTAVFAVFGFYFLGSYPFNHVVVMT